MIAGPSRMLKRRALAATPGAARANAQFVARCVWPPTKCLLATADEFMPLGYSINPAKSGRQAMTVISGCYWGSAWAAALDETETASWDFEIPPGTIFATSTLSSISETNGGWLGSGILEYRKRNEMTGVDQVITVANLADTGSLPAAIWDSNVDSVTFGMTVWDTGQSAPMGTWGIVLQQMWVIS